MERKRKIIKANHNIIRGKDNNARVRVKIMPRNYKHTRGENSIFNLRIKKIIEIHTRTWAKNKWPGA